MAYQHSLRTEHGGNWDRFTAWDTKAALKHESSRVRRRRERVDLAAAADYTQEDLEMARTHRNAALVPSKLAAKLINGTYDGAPVARRQPSAEYLKAMDARAAQDMWAILADARRPAPKGSLTGSRYSGGSSVRARS